MAKVHVCNVVVLDNPSPFLNPFQFEITFDCIEDLQEDLEWRIIYVGSAEAEELDQVLDTVYVGPVYEGRHMFVFQAEPPDPLKIPVADVVGVTVVLLTCSYRGQEFMRVGYYVNNDYEEPELRENPPAHPLFDKLHRNLLATNPHVTSFKIDWDDAEGHRDSLSADGGTVCMDGGQGAIVVGQAAIQGKWNGSNSQLKASQNSKGPSESLLRLGPNLKFSDMDAHEGECQLPKKPEEPSQADCCGSGCSYCVFDVYQRELAKWQKDCENILKGERHCLVNEALSQLEFKSFELVGITTSAEQLNIYRFSVPEGLRLDINPGQHLMMKGYTINKCDVEEGEESEVRDQSVITTIERTKLSQEQSSDGTFPKRKYLSRAYTILNNQPGYFETLIKVYSNGEMSQYIRTLKVGDCVLWRGPFGDYCHVPSCSDSGAGTILAICAGTGIAPVYAISKAIVNNEDDETRIRLLWSNHSWNYLPLVREIKELISYWNFSCRLFFSNGVDVPSGSDTFFEVTKCKINFQFLVEELDSIPTDNVKVLLCGSLSFEEDMMAFLNKLGLQSSTFHRFQ